MMCVAKVGASRRGRCKKRHHHDTDTFFMPAITCRGRELDVLKYSPSGSGRIYEPLLRVDGVIE